MGDKTGKEGPLTTDSLKWAEVIRETLLDHKGERVVVLDMAEVTLIADYFVIATGHNFIQVRALADYVQDAMAAVGARLLNPQRYDRAHWILLDYGPIVVHIFTEDEREFYDLERFWGDARVVEMESAAP